MNHPHVQCRWVLPRRNHQSDEGGEVTTVPGLTPWVGLFSGIPQENRGKTIGKPSENRWKTIGQWRFDRILWDLAFGNQRWLENPRTEWKF